MMRSAFSGVTSRYHAPSGYTTQIGPPVHIRQALALGAIARAIRPGQVELLHPALHVHPCRFAGLGIRAIRAQTDEEMPHDLADAEGGGGLLRRLMLQLDLWFVRLTVGWS